MAKRATKRVLGIDPFSRGVGFAVLEGPGCLVDWGLKGTGRADNLKSVRIIESLIERFRPDVLAIEDWHSGGSRRCARVRKLLDRIASQGAKTVRVRLITRRQIRALGPWNRVNTKHGRACFLAEQFPELQAFLPRLRKAWMSEENRMAIFDAVGFARTCFPMQSPASAPADVTRPNTLPEPSSAEGDAS